MPSSRQGRIKGAILLGAASLMWMFGPKIPLDRQFAKKPLSETSAVTSHSTREVASTFTDLSTPAPKKVDQTTYDVIRRCLPDLDPTITTQNFSLMEFVDHLRSSRSATSSIEVQNMHVVTQDGSEIRLMIAPSDSSEFTGLEAQLFSVDREGLPVPEKMPLSIEPRDIEAAKKHFLSLGNLIFSETSYVFKDEANKVAGKFTYSFDELASAELSQNGRFLGCSKSITSKSVACKCL